MKNPTIKLLKGPKPLTKKQIIEVFMMTAKFQDNYTNYRIKELELISRNRSPKLSVRLNGLRHSCCNLYYAYTVKASMITGVRINRIDINANYSLFFNMIFRDLYACYFQPFDVQFASQPWWKSKHLLEVDVYLKELIEQSKERTLALLLMAQIIETEFP